MCSSSFLKAVSGMSVGKMTSRYPLDSTASRMTASIALRRRTP